MVAKEKKKIEVLGDIPEMRKDKAPQLYRGEGLLLDGCTELHRNREQQACGAGSGYVCIRTYCDACMK